MGAKCCDTDLCNVSELVLAPFGYKPIKCNPVTEVVTGNACVAKPVPVVAPVVNTYVKCDPITEDLIEGKCVAKTTNTYGMTTGTPTPTGTPTNYAAVAAPTKSIVGNVNKSYSGDAGSSSQMLSVCIGAIIVVAMGAITA